LIKNITYPTKLVAWWWVVY